MRAILMLILMTMALPERHLVCQISTNGATESMVDKSKESGQLLSEHLAILATGKHSAALYANIAYSYYQIDDLANAVLYYEKAQKLAPLDKEMSTALEQVRSEIPIQITDIPDFILVRGYRQTAYLFNATTWSVIQLVLGGFLLYLSYVYLFRQIAMSLTKRWISIGLLSMSVIITGLLAYQRKYSEKGGDAGISMADQEVYEGPDERSGSVLSIGPGNKVFLLDTIGEWYKVQMRDKDIGWVKKDQITLI